MYKTVALLLHLIGLHVAIEAGAYAAEPAAIKCAISGNPADPANPVAYANRGDRCEGVFRQPVSASAQLSLMGVHAHMPEFVPGSGRPITVTPMSAKLPAALAVRVLSSRPRQYYRMDARIAPGARFIWKRDIADNPAVRLAPGDVKVLLCENSCDSAALKVVPASVAESRAPSSKVITLWFRAAVDLRHLYVTLHRQPGQTAAMQDADVLAGRMLPAGAAKDVLAALKPGTYSLKATAVPADPNAMDEVRAQIIVP
jgi:hypothetical protein